MWWFRSIWGVLWKSISGDFDQADTAFTSKWCCSQKLREGLWLAVDGGGVRWWWWFVCICSIPCYRVASSAKSHGKREIICIRGMQYGWHWELRSLGSNYTLWTFLTIWRQKMCSVTIPCYTLPVDQDTFVSSAILSTEIFLFGLSTFNDF